jgi:hypothetical protein
MQVTRFPLTGDAGYILKFEGVPVPNTSTTGSVTEPTTAGSNSPHKFVFIVDVSGSMGESANQILTNVIPSALMTALNTDVANTSIITFDSKATPYHFTKISEISKKSFSVGGMTYMGGVISPLEDILKQDNQPVSIVVISDGHIDDIEFTVAAVVQLSKTLKRVFPVRVLLIRFITSTHSQPDTRALTCIGTFNTEGVVPLIDVPKENLPSVLKLMCDFISKSKSQSQTSLKITSSSANLRRYPTDKASQCLVIPYQPSFTILSSGGDGNGNVSVNNEHVNFIDKKIIDVNEFVDLLTVIENKMKIWMVIRNMDTNFVEAMKWVKTFENSLVVPVTETTTNNQPDNKVMQRVQKFRTFIQKTEKGIIARIKELANQDKVKHFNSLQSAEFLRNTTSVSTAKRILKTAGASGSVDFDDDCIQSFTKIKQLVGATSTASSASSPDDFTSFYSTEGWADMFAAVSSLSQEELNQLNVSIAGQLLGGIGVPYESVVRDYPDPWTYNVSKVYCGLYLSESDLRSACIQGKGAELKYPGSENPITGVLPLRNLHPSAFDIYSSTPFAQIQASISMRGMAGYIPYDTVAQATAVLVCLLRQIGPSRPPSTIESTILNHLVQQIRHFYQTKTQSFIELRQDLCRDDCRPWLTGDLNVSTILKPLSLILSKTVSPNPQATVTVLEALFLFETFRRRKYILTDSKERTEALHSYLGIDLPKFHQECPVGEIGEPDGVCDSTKFFHHSISQIYSAIFDVSPYLISLEEFETFSKYSGFPFTRNTECLCVASVLQACHEEELVDTTTRSVNGVENISEISITTYIDKMVSKIYEKDFETRMQQKRLTEHQHKIDEVVKIMVLDSTTESEFKKLLCDNFSTPQSYGFDKLWKEVVKLKNFTKIFYLATGRDFSGEIVWRNGNFLYTRPEELFVFIKDFMTSEQKDLLISFYTKYRFHTYRENGTANRHGHNNEFRSFFGFGYVSKEAYFATLTEEKQQEYNTLHKSCCGNGVKVSRRTPSN